MNVGLWGSTWPWLLAAETGVRSAVRFRLPESPWHWALLIGGFLTALAIVVYFYIRDTRELNAFWKFWLLGLRLAALAALIVIAVDPHIRTERTAFRPSRVVILADTSASMGHEDVGPAGGSPTTSGDVRSRAEAVRTLLAETPLIELLREKHRVSLFTFDEDLAGPHHVFPPLDETTADEEPTNETATALNWGEVLEPRGLETRLGDLLGDLVRRVSGRTLSGVIVLTDGVSNAGVSPESANEAARENKVRLYAVGLGSTEPPVNLKLTELVAPTAAHTGDPFPITVLVAAEGLGRRPAEIELFKLPEGEEGEPIPVDRAELQEGTNPAEVSLPETDGEPAEVRFVYQPTEKGRIKFIARARPIGQIREREEDNQLSRTVEIFDRPTRVLLMAGGPMRDYRFLRIMLNRDPSVKVDVWLQTVDAGTLGQVSQEADRLLAEFPDRAQLFNGFEDDPEHAGYDVIVAFDPDWARIPPDRIEAMVEWIATEGGGLILVAGDIYTPDLASATEQFQTIRNLYPVTLASVLGDFEFDAESATPRRIEWTRPGRDAQFLQLDDDPGTSREIWESFPGLYRVYPTHGAKAGATVYATFPDPRLRTEYGDPVLMASQYYGEGRVFYLGSGATWRLRSIDETYFDRFWTQVIREIGQGRATRGNKRAQILLERNTYYQGETVRVRARIRDARGLPLEEPTVDLEILDPHGRTTVTKLTLDRTRPGRGAYLGDFRATTTGEYRLTLQLPAAAADLRATTSLRETTTLQVVLPQREDRRLQQDAQTLRALVRDTGGRYLSFAELLDIVDTTGLPQEEARRKRERARQVLAELFPPRGEPFRVDERIRKLWDRAWVLYLLVGLLSVEWLTRKLLKLA